VAERDILVFLLSLALLLGHLAPDDVVGAPE
jgi:hypothetical protein